MSVKPRNSSEWIIPRITLIDLKDYRQGYLITERTLPGIWSQTITYCFLVHALRSIENRGEQGASVLSVSLSVLYSSINFRGMLTEFVLSDAGSLPPSMF